MNDCGISFWVWLLHGHMMINVIETHDLDNGDSVCNYCIDKKWGLLKIWMIVENKVVFKQFVDNILANVALTIWICLVFDFLTFWY